MADNNNVLTIVLVVAAVLLFSGNLTGNAGRVPGSQVNCVVQASTGKVLAPNEYDATFVENGNVLIERNNNCVLTKELCPDTGVIANQYGGNRKSTTDSISSRCIPIAVSITLFPESY